MKTNLQNVRLIALLIAITAAFVTQTVHAQGTTIVMTEESSSVLDVTFNGTDITATGVSNTSADHWTITLPTPIATDMVRNWFEPENPSGDETNLTGFNTVTWGSPGPTSTQLFFVSDTRFLGQSAFPNGGIFINSISGLHMQVTDVSDGAVSAPDTGSTFGLLALALAALFGVSRFRALRSA
jgi:protein with PEP-CTERM/exosortase system signal